MSRDWRIYLDDIVASCEKVQRYTKGLNQQDFLQNEQTYDAVVRNLEIVGEAAKHIPDDARKGMSGIDWSKVAGLRDILAHDYLKKYTTTLNDRIRARYPHIVI